jgi:hypothetical protein
MFYEIGVIAVFIFILIFIDKILLFLFGSSWKMLDKYEEKKDKRKPPTFGL